MKNMNLKLAVSVSWMVFVSQVMAVDWGGGTGQWTNGVNWVGGVVPAIDVGINAVISSGTAVYDASGGDFKADLGSRVIIDGGSLTQDSTAWMKFISTGQFEVSNGGSLQTGANVVQIVGGGASSIDGVGSSFTCTGGGPVSIENSSSLSISGGATATLPKTTLWDLSQLNISGASVVIMKNLFIEGPGGSPSRVNLSDSARLSLAGANAGVITISAAGDSFLNLELGYTGYITINGIDQTALETMIADGKFGINGSVDTTLASYAYTTNINVVNIGLIAPPVPPPYVTGFWLGGNGNWFDNTQWSSGIIPETDGVDDVEISSSSNIVVTYVPGPDLVFNLGSDLLLDGSTLYQDSSAWTRFSRGSTLTITNGGAWLFESTHLLLFGFGTGETTHHIDNGTFSVRELEADDQQIVVLTNGATATISVYADISNGARFDVMDATLNLGEVALYEFEGSNSFINVNDGASVNLDAGFYTEGFKTNVIQKTGGSMINFSPDSSGEVFIDNISRADVETLIGQSKFGEGGVISATVSDYTIIAESAGQRIRVVPLSIGSISSGTVNGDFILSWDSFDGQNYEIQYKTDLIGQPAWGAYANVVGLGGTMSVTVSVVNAEAFYRVVSE